MLNTDITLDSYYNLVNIQTELRTMDMAAELNSSQILVIDDSNRICSMLVSNIVRQCATIQRTCHIVQSGELGLIETVPMVFANEAKVPPLTIYTANSPVNALPVLRLNHIKKLTIICDIIMPADTNVGLVGLLRELAERKLLVNLVFASSEGQNRAYVEQLIKHGKAYFLEKGTQAWIDIPVALVQREDLFQFKPIVRSDYDYGRLPEKSNPAPPPRPAINDESAQPASNQSHQKSRFFWKK